jgi:hypothetical protein
MTRGKDNYSGALGKNYFHRHDNGNIIDDSSTSKGTITTREEWRRMNKGKNCGLIWSVGEFSVEVVRTIVNRGKFRNVTRGA